ncbi:MAG TPA: FAD binding domain-containing protein [Ktedonobacteraceae bacterium]|jgi:CO/xanthine dehydrogenase FAD-binding subunit|nr:FAD binding domain-containing protein [Ktedonobacteraceae bacterium]
MLLKLVEYHWAEHIDDALLLLARLDTRTVPLAGGTHLLGLQDESIEAVVDLRDLDLATISETPQGLHIGAMATLQDMVDAPVLKSFASGLISRAALLSSSSRLIRNCATLGGTLGAGVASQADLLTALVALDAQVVVRSGSKTELNLSGGTFERPGLALSGVVFKGKQERRVPCGMFNLERRPNELIVEVIVPALRAGSGTSLLRVSRSANDVALLNVAALVEIEEDVYKRARVAFGGVNMEPVRVLGIERQLEGQAVARSDDTQRLLNVVRSSMADFRPPDDARASSGYRRVCGVNLAYRALEEATGIAQWRGVVSSERGV